MEKLTVDCACYSAEHTMRLMYDEEDGYVYVSVHLAGFTWYERIWFALKYIFGHKCKYGCFEEIVVDKQGCRDMIGLLEKGANYECKTKGKEVGTGGKASN